MKLTPQQHAAIHRTGQDVCVIAGPGSGKTRVLAERFSWLVSQGTSPRNILALTFTEKAASEIQSRIARTKHAEIEFAPISTLHGLCKRILSEFAIAAGLDPTTELWDERIADAELHAAAEEVLNEAARSETASLRSLFTIWNSASIVPDLCGLYDKVRSLSETFPAPQPPPDLPRFLNQFLAAADSIVALQPTTDGTRAFAAKFAAALEQLRQLGEEPTWQHAAAFARFPGRARLTKVFQDETREFYEQFDLVKSVIVTSLVTPERNYLIELLSRIAANYEARKRAAARMDFHDLEHRTIALLTSQPSVREELRRRFDYILMDEMQDTNPVQWRLIDLLRSPGNFFAVGDINQSIYGFRFAEPKQFDEYRESLVQRRESIDVLGHNFRSREDILAFTEAVTGGLPGIQPANLVAGREFQTHNRAVSLHPFENSLDEFHFIAAEIAALRESFVVEPKSDGRLRRLSLSDVAILVRTAQKAEEIAAVLGEHGIPFTLGGGRNFFETQEVADCISYLQLLANPLNTIARAAVLRSPFVAMTDDQLLQGETDPVFEAMLAGQRARLDDVCPDRFLMEALDASGYVRALNPSGKANIEKFLRVAREIWQQRPLNIRQFANEFEELRIAAKEKSATVATSSEAVRILTVHASKGLEFPVVFVASAYFSSPTNRSSLNFAAPDRIGVRWTNPIDGKPYADMVAATIQAEQKDEEEHELQRQLYVALTRAEQKLYVSWAGKQKRGWFKYIEPHTSLVFSEGPSAERPADAPPVTPLEPAILKPLGPQPPILSSATPTDLAVFAQCPRRFFLDKLAGLEKEAPARQLGTVVHEILAGESEDDSAEAHELAQVFFDSPLQKRVDEAVWRERELDLVFAIDDLVLNIKIDLCFEEPNGEITVVDYKTDHSTDGNYDTQMAIYREALSRLYPGKRIRSFLFYLRSNTLKECVEPLDRRLLARFQSDDSFDTQAGPHCHYCPHLAQACEVTE